ncbi:hypothetical protein NP493_550g04003 [Ridgeia piscesae]|uniref:5'-nucleotidase n=1 Tax=Ridgeia piscesae TaxID=27915 RepID=A0AAD9NRU9_RIDPI|nr:hypothetical protein NP493_550g04003 [Ridgeia piscesae]
MRQRGFDTKQRFNVKRLEFLDPIPPIQAEVDKLRAQNVNKIFVLGHGGYVLDQKIAKQVKGIDIVVGGHSHTFLYTGNPPSREKPEGDYPTVVKQDSGDEVLVVQASAYGKYLGFLQLEFDDAGKVTSWAGQPILLDKTVEQGSLLTTAIWYEKLRPATDNSWTDVSAAVINGGTVRVSVESGNITMEEVMEALPFRNSIVSVDLEGRHIIEMLEHSIKDYNPHELQGKFLQMSGNLLSDILIAQLQQRSPTVQGLDDTIVFETPTSVTTSASTRVTLGSLLLTLSLVATLV